MVYKGFTINGFPFRIDVMTNQDVNAVLIESWNCETEEAKVYAAPGDLLEIQVDFGSAQQRRRLLAALGRGQPVDADRFLAAIKRIFGGHAPQPARMDDVAEEYRKCYKYEIEMLRKYAVFSVLLDIRDGDPPEMITLVGLIKIPIAYGYRITGRPVCCSEQELLSYEDHQFFSNFWLTDEFLADIRNRRPLHNVLKNALRREQIGVNPPAPQPGTRPFHPHEWTLGLDSPNIEIGPE